MRLRHVYLMSLVMLLWSKQAMSEPFTLDTSYVAKGVGVELSVPRIKEAVPRTTPLPEKLEPGGTISPIFQDLFPCRHFLCRREYGGMVIVMLSRAKAADANRDPTDPEQTRRRADALLASTRASRERTMLVADLSKASRLIEDTLEILRIGDSYWAHTKRVDADGKENGSVYWQILDSEHTLTVSMGVDWDKSPHDLDFAELESFFSDFVRRIKVTRKPAK